MSDQHTYSKYAIYTVCMVKFYIHGFVRFDIELEVQFITCCDVKLCIMIAYLNWIPLNNQCFYPVDFPGPVSALLVVRWQEDSSNDPQSSSCPQSSGLPYRCTQSLSYENLRCGIILISTSVRRNRRVLKLYSCFLLQIHVMCWPSKGRRLYGGRRSGTPVVTALISRQPTSWPWCVDPCVWRS